MIKQEGPGQLPYSNKIFAMVNRIWPNFVSLRYPTPSLIKVKLRKGSYYCDINIFQKLGLILNHDSLFHVFTIITQDS